MNMSDLSWAAYHVSCFFTCCNNARVLQNNGGTAVVFYAPAQLVFKQKSRWYSAQYDKWLPAAGRHEISCFNGYASVTSCSLKTEAGNDKEGDNA